MAARQLARSPRVIDSSPYRVGCRLSNSPPWPCSRRDPFPRLLAADALPEWAKDEARKRAGEH
jgi:hypothetical protein